MRLLLSVMFVVVVGVLTIIVRYYIVGILMLYVKLMTMVGLLMGLVFRKWVILVVLIFIVVRIVWF